MNAADVNLTELVARALRQNLRDTTGGCVCDEAYTDRGLVDPHCGWHEAEGTTDSDSVARILAAFRSPEVLAGIAGVLREHQRWAAWTCICGEQVCHVGASSEVRDGAFGDHQAAAVAEWITKDA